MEQICQPVSCCLDARTNYKWATSGRKLSYSSGKMDFIKLPINNGICCAVLNYINFKIEIAA